MLHLFPRDGVSVRVSTISVRHSNSDCVSLSFLCFASYLLVFVLVWKIYSDVTVTATKNTNNKQIFLYNSANQQTEPSLCLRPPRTRPPRAVRTADDCVPPV